VGLVFPKRSEKNPARESRWPWGDRVFWETILLQSAMPKTLLRAFCMASARPGRGALCLDQRSDGPKARTDVCIKYVAEFGRSCITPSPTHGRCRLQGFERRVSMHGDKRRGRVQLIMRSQGVVYRIGQRSASRSRAPGIRSARTQTP